MVRVVSPSNSEISISSQPADISLVPVKETSCQDINVTAQKSTIAKANTAPVSDVNIFSLCDPNMDSKDPKVDECQDNTSRSKANILRDKEIDVFSLYSFAKAISEFVSLLNDAAYNQHKQQRSHIDAYVDLSDKIKNHKIWQAATVLATGAAAGVIDPAFGPYLKEAGSGYKYALALIASVGSKALNASASTWFDARLTPKEAQKSIEEHFRQVMSQTLSRTENQSEKAIDLATRIGQIYAAARSNR